MSDLNSIERLRLEKYLDMPGGFVCDFTNARFKNFVLENTGIDVYEAKYAENGESKANRLRTFWKIESNYTVAKLLAEMVEYWKVQQSIAVVDVFQPQQPFNQALYDECIKIIDKLRSRSPVENIDALTPNSGDKDFSLLAQSIKESIAKDEPEQALDRLHTFVVKYMRTVCDGHEILYDKDTPLHGLFGMYVKFLKERGMLKSDMSEKILKSSIAVMDAFNVVRNNQSFAHDNPILNHDESILIFNNISNTIRFIMTIEKQLAENKKQKKDDVSWDDLSFDSKEERIALDYYVQGEIDRRLGK